MNTHDTPWDPRGTYTYRQARLLLDRLRSEEPGTESADRLEAELLDLLYAATLPTRW